MSTGTDTSLLALVELRRWRQARPLIEAQLAVRPQDADLLGLLAQCLIGLEDYRGALRVANQVIGSAPDAEWGYLICAIALDELGGHSEAIRAASEAVRLAPDNWRTHNIYAQVACDLPKTFEDAAAYRYDAHRAADEAVRLAPNEADAHFTMGVVCQKRGLTRIARKAYKTTLALDPEHAPARNNLTTMTNPLLLSKSVTGYAQALRQAPDLEVAKENIDQLAQLFTLPLMAISVAFFIPGFLLVMTADGPSIWSALVGAGMIATLTAYVAYFFRCIPRSIRGYFARQLVTPEQLWYAALWVWAPIATMVACFLPVGETIPSLAAVGMIILGMWVGMRILVLAAQ
ncbi:tetratricopeptide repeat protein [Nocardioides sp. NPDC004968]|uniref:tetratricopeptide repeat protein n=1 Tax=Nocardioides sp. NPDC004968 TaxID=3155894 RepID=UPI0033B14BF0